MKEKDIKRIIRKQLKSNHPNWQRLSRKQKKKITKEITDAAAADYQEFDEELDIPIEELIGIEQQQPDSRIIPLQDMADFVDNFYTKAGLLKFSRSHKSWTEIHNEELRFIDELLDNRASSMRY
jgi:acyl-CoA reductase-like NAD-dependent aldehyde dehydrogenase